MDKSNKYFFFSGLISLSLSSLILLFFFQMIFSTKKTKVYALKKDNFISVSFEMPKKKEPIQKTVKEKAVVQETEPVVSKPVDVQNLFSDVWTKKIKPQKKIKKKQVNKRLQEVLTKTKTITRVKKKISTQPKEVTNVVSTGDEVNEYRAKIQSIVYNNFNPPPNSQGNTVVAVIFLGAMGKVDDFRILRYSENKLLNDECDRLKLRLINKLFPKNPDNKSGNYKIILTSKE